MSEVVFNKKLQVSLGIFCIWLFHISGILGIYLGDTDWFITKAPLNLTVSFVIFMLLFPVDSIKKNILFLSFFLIGMLVEWLGVQYELLFGTYSYGENLGLKFDGVPFLIGIYWAMLTFITAELAKKMGFKNRLKITVAALLMTGLDFLMEQSAPAFDFWEFKGPIPLNNYIDWFFIGLIMQILLHFGNVAGNVRIALHLFLAQVLFFGVFL